MIQKNSILLELNESQTKVKISPIGGSVVGVDGRTFSIDGASVIENTRKNIVDIMLDKAHFSDEAMGWFSLDSLEARDDGIYASLELNDAGSELVAKKLFRYLSPAYEVANRSGVMEVVRIDSIGLVNKPNLVFDALNNQENKGDKSMNEVEELKAKNTELEVKNKELEAQIETLVSEKKQSNEANKKAKIEDAIKRGELLPNRKESAQALDGVALENFLEVAKNEALLTLNQKQPNLDKKDESNALDSDVAKMLGIGE